MMKISDVVRGRPALVAEISANHNGDIERAKELIKLAAASGADLVKIQTYNPESMTIDGNQPHFKITSGPWAGQTFFELYRAASTPLAWQKELFAFAKKEGILLFSTPFDDAGVEVLQEIGCPFFKIASFEITDHELIRKIASTGKDTIMSTGTANLQEIEKAVSVFTSLSNGELILLHANSAYPAPIEEANLSSIPLLQEKFRLRIGLSDHTLGVLAPVIATALGASLIEKHFTDSRLVASPDSFFSSEPHEFKLMREQIALVAKALGRNDFRRPDSELVSSQYRRSLMFNHSLKKGHILSRRDIGRYRPGGGLQPSQIELVVGQELKRDVERGDYIRLEDFEMNHPKDYFSQG